MPSSEPTFVIDPALKAFAETDKVKNWIDAVNQAGSIGAVERAQGVSKDLIGRCMRRLAKRAGRLGYAPGHFEGGVAPGYLMGKVTVQRGPDGSVERVWERQHPDIDPEEIKAAVRAFAEEINLPTNVPNPPELVERDVIPWIQIGDAHLGMLAHEAETGENFDLKIAERELCTAFSILIDELGPHERIVINDLGDFTHYENFAGKTEASGHDLDYDSRFPKMIKYYSRVMRFIVDKVLEKAQQVDVIVNQGNHSRTNDIWMAELLRVAYGHTGRVNVLNNDSVFIGYRMGKTLVMVHHSDKCRPQHLTGVMITDFRKDFGETEYHYIDIGHIHHNMVTKEYPSVQIESFNQLAAADKYAHDNGYRSRQSITVVLRSRTYGEIGRKTLPITRVRDTILKALPKKGNIYIAKAKEAFTV